MFQKKAFRFEARHAAAMFLIAKPVHGSGSTSHARAPHPYRANEGFCSRYKCQRSTSSRMRTRLVVLQQVLRLFLRPNQPAEHGRASVTVLVSSSSTTSVVRTFTIASCYQEKLGHINSQMATVPAAIQHIARALPDNVRLRLRQPGQSGERRRPTPSVRIQVPPQKHVEEVIWNQQNWFSACFHLSRLRQSALSFADAGNYVVKKEPVDCESTGWRHCAFAKPMRRRSMVRLDDVLTAGNSGTR